MLRPITVDHAAPPRLQQIQEIMAWSQRRLSPAALAWFAALPGRLDRGAASSACTPRPMTTPASSTRPIRPTATPAARLCKTQLAASWW